MARKTVVKAISLPPALLARVEKRCAELDTTVSFYIQQLLRQDLGMPSMFESAAEQPPAVPYQQKVAEDPHAPKKGSPCGSTGQHHTLPDHDRDKPA